MAVKTNPERDESRAQLAQAIEEHATAQCDLDAAHAAEQRASSALYDAMRRVDAIKAEIDAPLDADAVVNAFSSDASDIGLLTRPAEDLRARMASAEREIITLTAARERFASVIDERRKALETASRRVDQAVAVVVAAEAGVAALIKRLEDAQAEVLAQRCVLWALHSALPYGDEGRAAIEKTLGNPWLMPEADWRRHPVGASHQQAIAALRINPDAPLAA